MIWVFRLVCSKAALPTSHKILPIGKLVEFKMLDFIDHTGTGISILTSAADNYGEHLNLKPFFLVLQTFFSHWKLQSKRLFEGKKVNVLFYSEKKKLQDGILPKKSVLKKIHTYFFDKTFCFFAGQKGWSNLENCIMTIPLVSSFCTFLLKIAPLGIILHFFALVANYLFKEVQIIKPSGTTLKDMQKSAVYIFVMK